MHSHQTESKICAKYPGIGNAMQVKQGLVINCNLYKGSENWVDVEGDFRTLKQKCQDYQDIHVPPLWCKYISHYSPSSDQDLHEI